jgi:hypothetical protein
VRKLEGTTFVAFTQTEASWTASYQDDALTMTFHGQVERILSRMSEASG